MSEWLNGGETLLTFPISGGGGGGSGSGEVDFGTTPSQEAFLAISGQTGITASSVVKAWLVPLATADHSIDEHLVDGPDVYAYDVVAGVGFSIVATAYNRPGSTLTGAWSVAWEWV